MSCRCQQQVCCVTGAAKGIGLACASCLGHEGAKVVVADIDEEGAKRCVTTRICIAHSTCCKISSALRDAAQHLVELVPAG